MLIFSDDHLVLFLYYAVKFIDQNKPKGYKFWHYQIFINRITTVILIESNVCLNYYCIYLVYYSKLYMHTNGNSAIVDTASASNSIWADAVYVIT